MGIYQMLPQFPIVFQRVATLAHFYSWYILMTCPIALVQSLRECSGIPGGCEFGHF